MTLLHRSLITALITALLSACGGEDSENLPITRPSPIQPLPSESLTVSIGNSTVDALRESVVITSLDNKEQRVWVESFKGIRYGAAQRFMHSEVLDLPSEVDATEFGAVCPQLLETKEIQSEDCLHLNIWRPTNAVEGDNLPVYLFIHGGNFETGSGSNPLVQGDTVVAQGQSDNAPFIVVTFNYRLGLLGTHWVEGSTSPNETHSGNYAIGDQKTALEWVQKNIAQFGGDTSNVTLIGQGAGAMSINIHQLSDSDAPKNIGYFSKAIMQSNISGFQYPSYEQAKATFESAQDESEAIFGTRNLEDLESFNDVLKVQKQVVDPIAKLTNWLGDNISGVVNKHGSSMSTLMPFSPYIEYHENLFSTYPGYVVKTQPSLNQNGFVVPTVIGSNSDESNTMSMLPNLTSLIVPIVCELKGCLDDVQTEKERMFEWLNDDANAESISLRLNEYLDAVQNSNRVNDTSLEELDPNVYELVTKLFFGLDNDTGERLLALVDYAKNDEHELVNAIKNMSQYRMMMNDMLYAGPARQQVIESSNNGISSTFYQFAYTPSFNVMGYTPETDGSLDIISALNTISCISAACNASELPFVFNKSYSVMGEEIRPNTKDKALMSKMSRIWFSDELFESYKYDANTDTVLIIDEQGEFYLSHHWDKTMQKGTDLELREGRLTGLNSTGILLNYMK